MSENAQKPRIRFKGFSDAWEQRKLGELSNIIDPHPSHRAPEEEEIGIPFVGIGDVDIDGNINYEKVRKVNESIYDEHHRRYDLAIPSLGIGRVASLGKVIRLRDDIGKYAVSPTMSIMQFTENSNIDFLYAAMNTEMFQRQFALQSNGSTRQSVGIQDLRVTEVSISPNGEEQKEIGAYFRNLDNLITLHQRKYDKLVAVKKSLLEKMFPADGETVPKIRFKGFSDAWEQRKLYDIADRFDNLRIPVAANLRIHGITPYYGANGIQDYVSGYTHDGEFVLVAEDGANDLKNYPVNYVKGRIWVNNHAHVLQGKAKLLDNKFLSYLINRADIESLLVGCGRAKLNAETMMNIVFLVPKYEEQIEIGNYLSKIDNLITLHQRQLEKLKNIKSALLEKMFV